MSTMTVSEARAALPELLSRVDAGEEITITRYGRPVAVVVRPDVVRSRRAHRALADAAGLHDLLTAARTTAAPSMPGLSEQYAEELIGDVRAGRQTR